MSPTLISNCMEFNEKFRHGDFTMQKFALEQQRYLELMASHFQEVTVLEKPNLPSLGSPTPASVVGKPPVSHRRSSTNYSTTTTSPTQLTQYVDTSIYSTLHGNILEPVVEERYRSRAYSEGAAMLSNDLLQDQQQQTQSATSRYKTELCRPFEESGKCKYGDKCQFAHGKHELRQMVRHPKYKTELCRTYHTSGLCPYGIRCHFIHNQDDSTMGAQHQAATGVQRSVSVSVPIAHPTPRLSNRPNNLQLMTQQRGNRVNSYSYSPPFSNSPVLEGLPFNGVNDNGLRSPISPPVGKGTGQFFNYAKVPMSPLELNRSLGAGTLPEHRQATPPLSQFDFLQGQRQDVLSDDPVFDPLPTPPDSDRESVTGSPPGFGGPPISCPQRLPIFRCLSQS